MAFVGVSDCCYWEWQLRWGTDNPPHPPECQCRWRCITAIVHPPASLIIGHEPEITRLGQAKRTRPMADMKVEGRRLTTTTAGHILPSFWSMVSSQHRDGGGCRGMGHIPGVTGHRSQSSTVGPYTSPAPMPVPYTLPRAEGCEVRSITRARIHPEGHVPQVWQI